MDDLKQGLRVSIPKAGHGTVAFIGQTEFATGQWIGINLDQPNGKNDGSIQGVHYFQALPLHGVFVRSSQVTIVRDDGPMLPPANVTPKTTTRPRSSIVAAAKQQQTSLGDSRPGSAAMKRTMSALSNASSASTPKRPVPPSAERRQSLASNISGAASRTVSPLASPQIVQEEEQTPIKHDPFSLKGKEMAKSLSSHTVPVRTHEEALLRLKILETRLAEQRTQMKDYETLKDELSHVNMTVKPKLQAKVLELAGELKDLKRQTTDVSLERDEWSQKIESLQEDLEMKTLDQELAEEKLEVAQANLDQAKEKVAELETELQVIKQRIDDPSINTGEESTSLAVLQLQKQNERLKEALGRLRDLTAENDGEHRKRMAELEKELELTIDLQSDLDEALLRADLAERRLEDLKLQLDDMMGAEDMLEQLTERNLSLSEKVEEMRNIVEDLEALKELNDELEENHNETEKQLLEEIDIKDAQIRELHGRIDLLEESVVSYESTITQFRDLVSTLQGDIDQLKTQQSAAEWDAKSLSSQSQTMLDLNLKLQSTVAKTQINTLDLELRKLDARHAAQQLAIVRTYLPAPFFEMDSDAVEALMFFDRLARLAEVIINAISTKYNINESLTAVVSEHLVDACETRGKLSRFAALCARFAANLRRCPPETFVRMGQIYRELAHVQKKFDVFLDALRKDQFKETECSAEIDKFIAQAAHIAESNLGESGLDLGELQAGQASSLATDLETLMAGLGYTKQSIALVAKEDEAMNGDKDLATEVFEPIQSLFDQARQMQNSSRKLHRRLEALLPTEEHVTREVAEPLADLARTVHLLAGAAIRTARLTNRYCTELRATRQSISSSIIIGIISEATTDLGYRSNSVMAALDTEMSLQSSKLAATLALANNSDHVVGSTYIAPWLERVAQIARNSAVNLEAEQRAIKMSEELIQLVRQGREKDRMLQEAAVKIELMEKRAEGVKHQVEALAELEASLTNTKRQAKAYEETIETLQGEMEGIEQENAKLKQSVSSADPNASTLSNQASVIGGADGEVLAFTGSLETAQLLAYIDSLRGSLKYVWQENAFLKSRGLANDLGVLPPLRKTTKSAKAEHVRKVAQDFKMLWKDTLETAAMPKMVDLGQISQAEKGWRKTSRLADIQVMRQKQSVDSLAGRMRDLTSQFEALELPVYS